MAYEKTNWVDGTTPVDATNMNKIEDELENLEDEVKENTDLIDGLIIVTSYSQDLTYPSGHSGTVDFAVVPPDGYKNLAPCAINCGNGNVISARYWLQSAQNVRCSFYNTLSNSTTGTGTVYMLQIKE